MANYVEQGKKFVQQGKILLTNTDPVVNTHPDIYIRRLGVYIQYLDSQTLILVLLYHLSGTVGLFYGTKAALTAFGFVCLMNLGAIYCSKLGCTLGAGGMFLIAAGLNSAWLVATSIIVLVFINGGKLT